VCSSNNCISSSAIVVHHRPTSESLLTCRVLQRSSGTSCALQQHAGARGSNGRVVWLSVATSNLCLSVYDSSSACSVVLSDDVAQAVIILT
jgi:hypothetical protein